MYPNSFWLVDASNKQFRQIDYFPKVSDTTATWMAWNDKGQLAWVQNVPEGLGIAITRVLPRR